jgi:hypothetical protein
LQRNYFVLLTWALSRVIVAAGLGIFTGSHVTVVEHFDGAFYHRIATAGYAYGRYSTVAFFPLYPAVVALVMRTGLSFDVAALLVSNLSFISMLFVAFNWVQTTLGAPAARWTVAFMAFFPMSLFGSLAYTEAPYMLLSLLALRDFDGRRYSSAAFWSGLASLTRPSAVWLMLAFLAATIIERRGGRSLAPALAAALGIALYSACCWFYVGDPFAFVRVQQIWHHDLAQGWRDWGVLLGRGTVLFQHWKFQLEVLPIAVGLVALNKRLAWWLTLPFWAVLVFVEHWIWDRDFAAAVMLILCGSALLCFRKQLGVACVAYGLVAILTVAFAGPLSVDRLLFAVIPLSIAAGALLSLFPTAGLALLWACAYDLFEKSVTFAANHWVA